MSTYTTKFSQGFAHTVSRISISQSGRLRPKGCRNPALGGWFGCATDSRINPVTRHVLLVIHRDPHRVALVSAQTHNVIPNFTQQERDVRPAVVPQEGRRCAALWRDWTGFALTPPWMDERGIHRRKPDPFDTPAEDCNLIACKVENIISCEF